MRLAREIESDFINSQVNTTSSFIADLQRSFNNPDISDEEYVIARDHLLGICTHVFTGVMERWFPKL